jgi:REP element-mobilizing transposase RayT
MEIASDGVHPTFGLMSTSAPTKYCYRRRLPHLQKADAALFVSFCTGAHLILPDQARHLVLEHCLREGGLRPLADEGARAIPPPRIHLYAAVIMPDHVHLLFLPLRDENDRPFGLVDILQCLKSTTAHRINKLLRTSGPVWEEESFDHVLRSGEGLREKSEYIRQNPVKAGLVERPEEYRWLWVEPELSS